MIYMRNITITTAKSATYLENVGLRQMIQVQPDIDLVHLFDADSGQRLHYS